MPATIAEMNDLRTETSPTAFARKARRVLDRFTISEISAVDRGANEYALVSIMKRRDDEKARIEKLAAAIERYEKEEAAKASTEKRKEPQMNSFTELVSTLAKRDGVSKTEAMRRTRIAHPEEFELYRVEPIAKVDHTLAKRASERNRRDLVDDAVAGEIAKAGGTRLAALRSVRRARPELFEGYAA